MRQFPAPIHNAVAAFTKLPGVGPKTALRYVFALLRLPEEERQIVARSIQGLQNVEICKTC
ncbi:recombination protein RecR, partial [Patescibacteria group bacterium]|nr:recombination protein RecR [Patescibacteria group bacterium]